MHNYRLKIANAPKIIETITDIMKLYMTYFIGACAMGTALAPIVKIATNDKGIRFISASN
jgi:hypothetical protein